MRISLIHGEDTKKSYEKFSGLLDQSKKRGFEIANINDIHKIVAQSLFEEKQVFVLERPEKIKLNDWKWLSTNASKYNSNLLIYYEGNAPAGVTKNLGKEAKIEKFDLPKIIFQFLESFWPGNSKNSLKLLNDLVETTAPELVFFMLARHLRDLYWVKVSPETLQIPDWKKNKLKNQAHEFTINNLQLIIAELAEVDIKVKTSDQDLLSSLDLLIIKYLK